MTDFLKLVLRNSIFDRANNMVGVSDGLKQDEGRVQALLDKMINQTAYCKAHIQ